jgi:hypothetical protein
MKVNYIEENLDKLKIPLIIPLENKNSSSSKAKA